MDIPDRIRRGYERFNERDWNAVARGLPDDFEAVDHVPLDEVTASGPRAVELITKATGDSAFADLTMDVAHVETATRNGGVVVALVRITASASGGSSGAPVETEIAQVWTFQDGVPRRCEQFRTWEEARQAAALIDSPAMSLIRESYEAINEGRLEWAADHMPPDFELVPTVGSAISGPFVGPEGVARFYSELAEVWETFHVHIEEVVDFGDRVVVLGRIRNKGRGSGVEVDVVAAHLWTIEGDVPVRLELIGDREEALRRARAESSPRSD